MNGNMNDHDLLIKLTTIVEDVKEDVGEIKQTLKCMNTECIKRVGICDGKYVSKGEVKRTATITGAVVSGVVAVVLWVGKAVFGIGG
jgi:hypothetical protein